MFWYFVDVIASKANEDPQGKGDGKHNFGVFFFVSGRPLEACLVLAH